MPRTGRRPGRSVTRQAILEAARGVFARSGYDRATIRDIAAAAGVDPALVHHYFGSKEGLFVAALALPFEPETILAAVTDGEVERIGERVASLLLVLWDSTEQRSPLLALVRSALSNEDAARMLREFLATAVFTRVATRLGMPDARLRAGLVASQVIGLAIARYVIRIEPLASVPRATLVQAIAPTIQRYLTGEIGGGAGDSRGGLGSGGAAGAGGGAEPP
jgi:AcrR family transcriptional regulator